MKLTQKEFSSKTFLNENEYNQNMPEFVVDLNRIEDLKKRISGQSKDEKSFLKALFKAYDTNTENFDEDSFINLTKIIKCPEVEKIVLALKYKENLNYKEKMKIIKELTKDLTLEYIFELDYIISSYFNDFLQYISHQNVVLENLEKNTFSFEIYDENTFFEQLAILKSAMNLIKCVKYKYHKVNILSINNKDEITKSITYNKIVAQVGTFISVVDLNLVDSKDIYITLKGSNMKIYSPMKAIYMIIYLAGLIGSDEIVEDLYSKAILRNKYSETVKNRITTTRDITFQTLNMKDFLRRKILLPKNGVVLLAKNNPYIESILLKEVLTTNYNNLVIVTKYSNGDEVINTLMIREWELSTDNKSINVDKREIGNLFPGTIDYVTHFFEMYDDEHYANTPYYEVIAPEYWKYRDRNYVSDNDISDDRGVIIRREYSVEIAPFVRKINGEAGNDAIKLSKKLGIILEDGYTIVRPHTRTYNKHHDDVHAGI